MSNIAKKGSSRKKENTRPEKYLNCNIDWDLKSLKKGADGILYIEGYANTKDKDRISDIVLPEAFTETMKEYMKNPMVLYMHDWDKIAGKVVEFKIDERGLWVKVQISNAKDCEDIRIKIKEGMLKTFSIGYNELDCDWDKETATNYVKEVELLEISLVSIPCNPRAEFTAVAPTEDEGKQVNQEIETKEIKMPDDLCTFISDACNLVDRKEDLDADFIKALVVEYNLLEKADKEENSKTYAIFFSKEKFSKDAAIKWAKENNHKHESVIETDSSWKIKQKEKIDFNENTFETSDLDEGIKTITGNLKD